MAHDNLGRGDVGQVEPADRVQGCSQHDVNVSCARVTVVVQDNSDQSAEDADLLGEPLPCQLGHGRKERLFNDPVDLCRWSSCGKICF